MESKIKNMSIVTKLSLVLALIVPVAVGLVVIIRGFQMRNILIETHGPNADMSGLMADVLISVIPTVLSVVAAAVIFILIVMRFLKPLKNLTAALNELARGNTAVNLKITGNDEVGQISMSVLEIVKTLNIMRDDFARAEKAIGEGHVTTRLHNENLNGIFDEIAGRFNNVKSEFLNFLDNFTEPVLIIDANNKVLYANNTIRQFTKTENKDINGIHVNEYLRGDVAGHEFVKKTFATGKTHVEALIQLQLNPGQLFDLELSCIPIHYNNKTQSIMVLLTNLSHIKAVQRLAEKRDRYRLKRFGKLTESLTEAFDKGNLNLVVPKADDFDNDTLDVAKEFDAISDIITSSVGNIGAYVNELQYALQHMASKNFDQELVRDYAGDFSKIKDSVNIILSNMNNFFSELYVSSQRVQEGATAISDTTQEMSLSFSEQLEFVSEVNEQVRNIDTEIAENLQNAQIATNLSSEAKEDAQSGSTHMADMIAAMDEIRISTDTIAGIIKTIQDIAFQTNLLALNASVEAARAGEHGRGFSVVAEAVRALAAQSAGAAEESVEAIKTSKEKVGSGVRIARDTAESLNKIVGGVENIDLVVEKIAVSSTKQSAAINQIKEDTDKIADMIKVDTQIAASNAAATEEMLTQSAALKDMIAEFNLRKQR